MPFVLTPGVVVFGSVVAFSFLFTFDKTFRHLFAPLLTRVANIGIGATRFTPGAHPFGFLNGVVHNVEQWTHDQMVACQRAMSWAIQTMRFQLGLIAETVGAMAHNYSLAFNAVWHGIQHAVPHVVRQTIVKPVQKAAHYSDAKLRARVRALEGSLGAIRAQVRHLTHATAGAIAAPFPRIGKLEREIANAVKGLRNVKNLARYATLAALGAAVLAKLGVNWVRCSRSKQFGKGLCKTNADWMTDFFALTILLQGTFGFRDFVEEAQEGFDLGLEGLQLFVREFKDLPIPKS